MECSRYLGLNSEDISSANSSREHLQILDVEGSAATGVSDATSIEKSDTIIVSWESSRDLENPKNWSKPKRWAITILVSAFGFTTPIASSMAAPALDSISRDLSITSPARTNLILSVFMLSYALGPFFFSPCSEIFGRKWVLQCGNVFFFLCNLACGFAKSEQELVFLRLMAGFGGSANVGIGSGVLSDCWRSEERGKGMILYQLGPVIGPVIAPIAGGFIAEYSNWRWTFWSVSIFSGILQVIAVFLLCETYAPRILSLKAKRLRKSLGNPYLRTEWDNQNISQLWKASLIRPWRLIATQPIIQILGLYQAFNYGLLYLLISSFPKLWEIRYGFSKSIASLHYLALLGSLIGSQISGRLTDRFYVYLLKRYGIENAKALPEFRIPPMIPAAILSTIGLFLFGWSAQLKLLWIWPDIGILILSASSITSYSCIQLYILDTYPRYTASASSASTILRSLSAFAFPLFAPSLFENLGYGMGSTVLGCICACLGIPATIVLWKFGAKIRAISKYAAGNEGVDSKS